MKKILFLACGLTFSLLSCQHEMIFDNNDKINAQIIKSMNDYESYVCHDSTTFVLSIKKLVNSDSTLFLIVAIKEISGLRDDSIWFYSVHSKRLTFSNYETKYFNKKCTILEAAKLFDEQGYLAIISYGRIPSQYYLWNIASLELCFYKDSLVSEQYLGHRRSH
jgi:hypothetical protein